jgi:lipid A ethanolaminephosphotransferase
MLLVFQDLAAVARNHRELRFQVAPANVVYALAKVGASDGRAVARPLEPIGTDARLGASWAQRAKPALLVVVVGETARAANWGLSGYARQTTPELAQVQDLVNFADVRSCGTNTEVSLPCMFAPVGRRDYDEARIRGRQSLLHVLDHAGLQVLWRDNQSGCKSVCPGLPQERLDAAKVAGLCDSQGCLDGVLLEGLAGRLDPRRSQVVVLHMHGSHGPAYSARYPRAFARFQPECRTAELRECTPQEVVNAYDNTLLYTDHVLAQTIAFLRTQQARFDTAMVYVSDHGESLGESGLYLHGLPWSIAPAEQTHVPMLMWLSPGYARSFALDTSCLRERAARPASHDNLFHTVLGLLDVRTAVHEPALDLAAGCRPAG